MSDDPFRPPQNIFVPSRGLSDLPKSSSGSRPLPAPRLKLLSVHGSSSFYKFPFDSLSVIRHPKNIFRSPHRLFRPPIFQVSQGPVRTIKVLCSSQALLSLRKSCSRNRNILPRAGQEPPWNFARSRSRQKTQIRLRKRRSLSVFSKPEKHTL